MAPWQELKLIYGGTLQCQWRGLLRAGEPLGLLALLFCGRRGAPGEGSLPLTKLGGPGHILSGSSWDSCSTWMVVEAEGCVLGLPPVALDEVLGISSTLDLAGPGVRDEELSPHPVAPQVSLWHGRWQSSLQRCCSGTCVCWALDVAVSNSISKLWQNHECRVCWSAELAEKQLIQFGSWKLPTKCWTYPAVTRPWCASGRWRLGMSGSLWALLSGRTTGGVMGGMITCSSKSSSARTECRMEVIFPLHKGQWVLLSAHCRMQS